MTSNTPTKKKKKETVSGFVSDLSPVKKSKNQKRSYFDFKFTSDTSQQRSVCFSPEKRRLLLAISTDEDSHAGCEISNFKTGDSGDMMITDFSTIRRCSLKFDKPEFNLVFTTIAELLNETPLYSM